MAIFKCKMCGGALEITEGITVAECEYCGTQQTVPTADNEKKMNLFTRANRLRAACEFDKAASIYESIVAEFSDEAEAYWGLVLCEYGIEYIDDPATGKKIPTCHRSSFESIMDDSDFEQVMEYADTIARKVYRYEAKQIEEIRKGIIAVSANEEPYDIFICYKETTENGDRTLDSVIAQDVYDELTDKGYRVFFSRITLEDKLGVEYEPYIFAALNSAKIMLVFGTDYEYFNAVWVKNEWSRYLKLMANDKSKHLIPCYKGVDAYDMPKEFAKLQAQDMGKVGATQDLLRGIEKILPKNNMTASVQTVAASANPSVESYLKRIFIFLEDGDFKSADEYCEKVLDIDPENAYAYLGKLMAELRICKQEELKNLAKSFDTNINYAKIKRFGDNAVVSTISGYVAYINERNEQNRIKVEQERINAEKEREQARVKEEQELLESKKVCNKVRDRLKSVQNLIKTNGHNVFLKADGTIAAVGSNNYGQCDVGKWMNIVSVHNGTFYTAGLKADGTVVAVGYNKLGRCDVECWEDIVVVSAEGPADHTVGLKSDGTVVAVGSNQYGQCNVETWKDIVDVYTGGLHTVGLKSNGTVVAVGYNNDGQCNVKDWTDIVNVFTGYRHTIGLKSNGNVVAVGNNKDGRCNVTSWQDIVDVSTGASHTVGLKSNGTVVAVGNNADGQCNVDNWRNIVAITTVNTHTVGLKTDGTVVATGNNEFGQCNVSDWTDIVAISAGGLNTIGLKSNGTVVAVGKNDKGQCNVSGLRLFSSIDSFDQERKESIEQAYVRAAENARIKAEQERKRADEEARIKEALAQKNLSLSRDALQAYANTAAALSKVCSLKNVLTAAEKKIIDPDNFICYHIIRPIKKPPSGYWYV